MTRRAPFSAVEAAWLCRGRQFSQAETEQLLASAYRQIEQEVGRYKTSTILRVPADMRDQLVTELLEQRYATCTIGEPSATDAFIEVSWTHINPYRHRPPSADTVPSTREASTSISVQLLVDQKGPPPTRVPRERDFDTPWERWLLRRRYPLLTGAPGWGA